MNTNSLKYSIIAFSTLYFIGCGDGNTNPDSTPENPTNNETTEHEIDTYVPSHVTLDVGVKEEACSNRTISESSVKYVATNGNDNTGDGTTAYPYKTVFHAVEEASAGDTIVIRGGTYVEPDEIRVRVPNVTLTSYPGEWAILDRTASGEADQNSGIYLDVDADGAKVECLEVKGGYYALSTETKLEWGEADKMGTTDVTIINTKLHESYADVVKIKPNSDDFNISYSEIYNSGIGQDPNECNAEGIDAVNADRISATHLHIHNSCSTGVYFKGGSTDNTIAYSLIEQTGEGGILLGFDTSPEYFDLEANPDYYEAINAKAHHNFVKETGGAGIGLFASQNSEVYSNTIVDASSRFHAPIYLGITYQDWEPEAKRPANINPAIHHNIVVQQSVDTVPLVAIRYSDDLGGLSGLSGALNIDYNCYYQDQSAAQFEDGRDGGWSGAFTQWQQHIAGEEHSLEVDPQLDAENLPQNIVCEGFGY